MSADEILESLIPELEAIRHGDCIWCERGEAHPAYSQCPYKLLVPARQAVPAYGQSQAA